MKLDVSANLDFIGNLFLIKYFFLLNTRSEMTTVNALVRIHVQIHIANQTRRIKNVAIFVWNQLALLLTRVIVFAIHHVTLDANVMKDLFETNMEIASNPNSVQILIVHIMKFTQVRVKQVCVRSDNLFF